MTKSTSLLDLLAAKCAAEGWSPADMAQFRMMADEGGGESEDGGDDGSGDGTHKSTDGGETWTNDKGFPENTPVADMTTEQQAAYWKFQSRKHEATAKARGDYDDLKREAAEAKRLRQERETEAETKIREAREEGEAEAQRKLAPRLVTTAFMAEAKGVLTEDERDALLEDLDLTFSKYLTDTGEVDREKVAKKVQAFAPAGGDDGKGKPPGTGGQGRRNEKKASAVEAGRAEAARRFGTKAGAQ